MIFILLGSIICYIGYCDMTNKERKIVLNTHNEYRSKTAGGQAPNQPKAMDMNELRWDYALEKIAADYAENCNFEHNPNRNQHLQQAVHKSIGSFSLKNGKHVGENLSVVSGQLTESKLEFWTKAWYEEYKYYNYNDQSCSAVCGHYTQFVNSYTRYVGCAYKYCPNGVGSFSNQASTLLVCNYYPSGNFQGIHPYEKASTTEEIASYCDDDRKEVKNNMCSGCMDPDYAQSDSNRINCGNGINGKDNEDTNNGGNNDKSDTRDSGNNVNNKGDNDGGNNDGSEQSTSTGNITLKLNAIVSTLIIVILIVL